MKLFMYGKENEIPDWTFQNKNISLYCISSNNFIEIAIRIIQDFYFRVKSINVI